MQIMQRKDSQLFTISNAAASCSISSHYLFKKPMQIWEYKYFICKKKKKRKKKRIEKRIKDNKQL